MRILFFADNFLPETNAPATHIYERCRMWVDGQGHEVTVITCAPELSRGQGVSRGIKQSVAQCGDEIDGIRVVAGKNLHYRSNAGTLWRTVDYASYAPSAL